MDWTTTYIKIYFWAKNDVPADITSGNPDPSKWSLPMANFDSQYGGCDVGASFPEQTIVSTPSLPFPSSKTYTNPQPSTSTQPSAASKPAPTRAPGPNGQTAPPKPVFRLARPMYDNIRRSSMMRIG